MPQEDYDIEALLGRIAALEKKLAEGVVVLNAGGMSSVKQEAPVKKEEPQPIAEEEEPVEEYAGDFPPDMDAPPDEAEMGGSVYMDIPMEKTPIKEPVKEPVKQETVAPVKVKSAPTGDAKATFGLFLRSVRKTARNGVLIALCMDLDSAFEDGVFVLYTESDTVYRSLIKDAHYTLIAQAFEAIGIDAEGFVIRLRGKKTDAMKDGVEEIKETFGGVKVEVK